MEIFDSIIVFAIVAGAAFYLYRKFAKSNKGGCGCGSESGCCGKGGGKGHSHCGGHMQHH